MKKLMTFFLFWTIFLSSFSQTTLYISGVIYETGTSNPIANHAVYIQSDSLNGGNIFPYYHVAYSDFNGHYGDTIVIPAGISQWPLIISTYDCNYDLHTFDTVFVSGMTVIYHNFYICVNQTTLPTVITGEANNITQTTVNLHGLVDPNGSQTYVTFEFGTTTSYGTYLSCGYYIGDSLYPVTGTLSNLTPGTLYHFRINGTNSYGTANGSDSVFTTLPADSIPVAITEGVTNLTDDGATIHGLYNAAGFSTTIVLEWGLTESYGSFTSGQCSGYEDTPMQIGLYGLLANTTYHYRAYIIYSGGTIYGNDSTFTTLGSSGCQADFQAYPDSNALYTYSFIDQSTGNIAIWNWDFGDGGSSQNQNPSHIYAQAGIYVVCLTVQGNDSSCFDTKCDTLFVGNGSGCQAQFSYYPDSVSGIDHTYQFIDLSSGSPDSWLWDFGDPVSGPNNFSTLQYPVHAFTSGDTTYYVCLSIQCQGVQSTWCAYVTVSEPSNCVSYFTYTPAGLSVNFQGYMLYGSGASYSWNFGDGQTGQGQSVVHNYSTQGIYYVTLTTIEDSTNCQYISSQSLMVGDSSEYNQIYGQVFAGNFPMLSGIVMIFSLDTTQNYSPFIATYTVDSMGIYYFSMVPNGNYLVYALPFSPDGYLPTYYGDVLNWQNATLISLGEASNPYNIHLIAADSSNNGDGIINGQVNLGGLKSGIVDKVTMLLMNSQGDAIAYYKVSTLGDFTFPFLGYGTYLLRAEITGVTSDVVQVVLSSENPSADVTMTFVGNKILGVGQLSEVIVVGTLFPNPVNENTNISIKVEKPVTITVELINLMGQRVSRFSQELNTGPNVIRIDAGNLSQGLYTLLIRSSDGLKIIRKLIKS